jgi:hypothetical protein
MANRATQVHVTLLGNTNENKHRPQQQKKQVTLFVNMNESKQRAKYRTSNSVKLESVFQIICLYQTTIFNQYDYIYVMLVTYPVSSCNYIPTFLVFPPIKRRLTSINIISNLPYHDGHTWFHIQPVYQSYFRFPYSLHK